MLVAQVKHENDTVASIAKPVRFTDCERLGHHAEAALVGRRGKLPCRLVVTGEALAFILDGIAGLKDCGSLE